MQANIVKALDTLCKEVAPDNFAECDRLIKKSTEELIDSVIADLSPQETCLYLKFCDASGDKNPDVEFIIPPLLDTNVNVGKFHYCVY